MVAAPAMAMAVISWVSLSQCCCSREQAAEVPRLAPSPGSAPWLDEESPFPDPLPSKKAPASAGATPAAPATARPATVDGGAPAARPSTDLGLPPLPDHMEVHRLPRASASNPEVDRRPPEGHGPVARVNGEEITREVYNVRVQRTLDAFFGLTRSMPRSIWKQVAGSTLQQLIHRTIDGQKARELGVTVSKEKMDEEFRRFIDDRGGPANWPRFLAHMHVTEEDVRQDVEAKVLHDALLARGLGDLTIGDAAVEEHYGKRRHDYYRPLERQLRQIFIATSEGYNAKLKLIALNQAEEAMRRVREQKQDFAAVARRHSEGATASGGGELGWLHRGQMPEPFEKVAFSIPVGSISDIVRTEMGFHIIQCLAERPGRQRPLDDELKAEIRKMLQSRLYQQRLGELYRTWYDQAEVEYLDPLIEAEAREVQKQNARLRPQ